MIRRICRTGTPEDIAADRHSYTGRFLKPVLARQNPHAPARAKQRAAGR